MDLSTFDVTQNPWRCGELFDAIITDPPCTSFPLIYIMTLLSCGQMGYVQARSVLDAKIHVRHKKALHQLSYNARQSTLCLKRTQHS